MEWKRLYALGGTVVMALIVLSACAQAEVGLRQVRDVLYGPTVSTTAVDETTDDAGLAVAGDENAAPTAVDSADASEDSSPTITSDSDTNDTTSTAENQSTDSEAEETDDDLLDASALSGPSVFFVTPSDGDEVTSPFEVEMGVNELTVEAAGEINENAGHMHILVNEEFVNPGEVILATDSMIHYGDGQTTATLDLEPGEHTLRLQFADGAHIALEGDQYRDEITVTVVASGHEMAAEHVHEESTPTGPSVFFVTPSDGDEVTSPFEVEMGVNELIVEAAGEINENAGHMHILVNEEFVNPGEVILATDSMIHYGDGQTTATLDLEPGEHTLRLQFADGAHIALEGDQYRDEITVTVK